MAPADDGEQELEEVADNSRFVEEDDDPGPHIYAVDCPAVFLSPNWASTEEVADVVDCGDAFDVPAVSGAFSLCAHVRRPAEGTAEGGRILSKGELPDGWLFAAAATVSFSVAPTPEPAKVEDGAEDAGEEAPQPPSEAGPPTQVVGSTAVNDGEWHHVAAVIEGGLVSLFLDGCPEGEAMALEVHAAPGRPLLLGPAEAEIAAGAGLKDVQAYAAALTPEQIHGLATGSKDLGTGLSLSLMPEQVAEYRNLKPGLSNGVPFVLHPTSSRWLVGFSRNAGRSRKGQRRVLRVLIAGKLQQLRVPVPQRRRPTGAWRGSPTGLPGLQAVATTSDDSSRGTVGQLPGCWTLHGSASLQGGASAAAAYRASCAAKLTRASAKKFGKSVRWCTWFMPAMCASSAWACCITRAENGADDGAARSLLASAGLGDRLGRAFQQEVVLDLFDDLMAYAESMCLTTRKTAVMVRILQEILEMMHLKSKSAKRLGETSSIYECFQEFKRLLLAHSFAATQTARKIVDREKVPADATLALGVFTLSEVRLLTEFLTGALFQQFLLYQCVLVAPQDNITSMVEVSVPPPALPPNLQVAKPKPKGAKNPKVGIRDSGIRRTDSFPPPSKLSGQPEAGDATPSAVAEPGASLDETLSQLPQDLSVDAHHEEATKVAEATADNFIKRHDEELRPP
eukprot:s678_g12.t3